MIFVLSVALVGLAGPGALAETVPGSAQLEHLERRFERPVTPRRFLEPEIPEAAKPLPPEEARKVRFVLSGVVADGVTVYEQTELAPLYEKYLAKEISLAEIYEVAAAITARYRQDGYILSRAFVPAQKVRFGIVHITVIEGFVDRVIIKGDVKGRRGIVEAMAQKITQERPLSLRVVERYGLLINDLPGLTAKTALRPSDRGPDAYDLVLTFEHKTLDVFATTDNRGSDFVGPFQFLVGANLNSVLGLYEMTRLRFATVPEPEELRFIEVLHQQNIGSEGTRITVQASHTYSDPGSTLAVEDINSRSIRAQLNVFHPIIRRRRENLLVNGIFSFQNSQSDAAGVEFRDDRLRVLRLALSYLFSDDWAGQNRATLTVSQGLNIFNASRPGSRNLSRADGRSDFTKVYVAATRIQKLAENWSVLFSANGQKTRDAVLSAEEIVVGGSVFGRAFDPAEIGGEDGGALKLELRFTRAPSLAAVRQYQLYTYVDAGAVWNLDTPVGVSKRQSLASAGLGLRVSFAKWVSLYLEGAKPFLRDAGAGDARNRGPRIFFGINGRF